MRPTPKNLSIVFIVLVVTVTTFVSFRYSSKPGKGVMRAAAVSSCKAIIVTTFTSPGTNLEPGKTYEGNLHFQNKGGAPSGDLSLYLTLLDKEKARWLVCTSRHCTTGLLQQIIKYKLKAGQVKDIPFWIKVPVEATCNTSGNFTVKIFDKDLKENKGFHTVSDQKVIVSCASGGPGCGNGRVEGEQCDDGNKKNGDGCNTACRVENGWKCVVRTRSVCTKK